MCRNKILYILKTEGIKGVIIRIVRKIIIVEYTYFTYLSEIKPKNNDFKLFVDELNDVVLKKMYNEYPIEIGRDKYEILKQNLKKSEIKIFVVKNSNNVIMGYYHLSSGDVYDSCTKYNIVKISTNIHLFDDYTFQNHRGNNAHSFSIYSRLNYAAKLGYKTATVNILAGNKFSEKAYLKYKYKKYKRIILIKILSFNRTYIKDYNITLLILFFAIFIENNQNVIIFKVINNLLKC